MQYPINLATRISVTPAEDSKVDIDLKLKYSITRLASPQLEQRLLNVCQRVIGSYLKPRIIDSKGQLSESLTHLISLKLYNAKDPSLKLNLASLDVVDDIMDELGGPGVDGLQILRLRLEIPVSWGSRLTTIDRPDVLYSVYYAYQVTNAYVPFEDGTQDAHERISNLFTNMKKTSGAAYLKQSEHLELMHCGSALILALVPKVVSTRGEFIDIGSSSPWSYCALM